jgi:hypothetical protein
MIQFIWHREKVVYKLSFGYGYNVPSSDRFIMLIKEEIDEFGNVEWATILFHT